jgi:hypothetical protein
MSDENQCYGCTTQRHPCKHDQEESEVIREHNLIHALTEAYEAGNPDKLWDVFENYYDDTPTTLQQGE